MTKNYTLPVLFFLVLNSTSAQFTTGQKVIGGNISAGYTKSNDYFLNGNNMTFTGIGINPTYSWFTHPNHLWGVGINYNYNQQRYRYTNVVDTSKTYSHAFSLSVFSQHYITIVPRFYFTMTASASAGYNFGKTRQSNSPSAIDNSGYYINLGLAPGLTYQLTNRLLFDAFLNNFLSAGYNHAMQKYSGIQQKGTQNNFSISSGLSNNSLGNVGLGFRWMLRN